MSEAEVDQAIATVEAATRKFRPLFESVAPELLRS
jgi:hypothetical protein